MGLYQNLLFMNTLEDARAWGFVGFKRLRPLKRRWTVFRRRKEYIWFSEKK